MFNQQELQILLGGVNSPIDLDDLRGSTQYGGLYNDHEYTIQLFWQVRRMRLLLCRRVLTALSSGCQHIQPGRPQEAATLRDELQSASVTVRLFLAYREGFLC